MMKDPEVHFHVIPRYANSKTFADTTFEDTGWPLAPDLKFSNQVSEEIFKKLTSYLQEAFVK